MLRRKRLGERLVVERRAPHAHVRRLGDVGVAHRIGHARRLQHQMEAIRAERSSAAMSKFSRMLSSTSAMSPCAVRRDLDQIDAAIIGRDRRHRLAAMAGEILRRQHRARARQASPPCRRRSGLRRTRAHRPWRWPSRSRPAPAASRRRLRPARGRRADSAWSHRRCCRACRPGPSSRWRRAAAPESRARHIGSRARARGRAATCRAP